MNTALCLLALTCLTAAQAAVPAPPAPPAGVRPIEVQSWRAGDPACAPAEPLVLGGWPVLKCRCNFAGTTLPRGVWDGAVDLDFTRATALVFDFYAEQVGAISHGSLFLRSGTGWYGAPWYPSEEGAWCRVRIPKSAFTVDAPAAGWSRITTVRLSPWAMKREDAVLYFANLGLEESDDAASVVVQEYADDAAEQQHSTSFAATVQKLFETSGLRLPSLSTLELTPELLRRSRLVILPYAAKMPPETARLLADYVRGGGKLIACFSVPGELAALLGVKQLGYRSAARPGEFSSMRWAGTPPAGVPAAAGQRSWGICAAEPVAGVGTVAAWWHDDRGERTDAPAIITSANGAWFSHIVLADDAPNKAALLLGLAGRYVPELSREACARRLGRLGSGVTDLGWDEAVKQVRALPLFATTAAPAALDEAVTQAAAARRGLGDGDWSGAGRAADAAEAALMRAYCVAQQPVAPEFRGAWCHPREGIAGWGWEKTADRLRQAGIDHLFLNVLHGASTSYPSRFAPFDRGDADGHDYLSEAVAACGKRGIQVHVWITNYKPDNHAPEALMAKLKAEGRLQVDRDGAVTTDLCPSHEANLRLQRDLMLEAATWPGVAGVHFDYIRYPDDRACFCATCRHAFEARVGHGAATWPGDALSGGPLHAQWVQFRCDTITGLVRDVSREVRRRAPRCRLSAAVFSNYPNCREGVGQDWGQWVREGLLDFVCPMDYTHSQAQFRNLVQAQLAVVGAKVPCYPGIGLLTGLGPVGAVKQIQTTRDLKTGGFIVWSVYPEYIDAVFPYLGMGVLKPPG